ncbi:MAG: J domain-containing protein [Halorientalis sp.]
MGETFYSVLGVDPDADTQTIQAAYRERVKDHHPDVSEADDAAETFKRLTDARDVLLDDESRERYDRLGHDAYVRDHLDSAAWSVSEPAGGAGRAGERTTTGGRGDAAAERDTSAGGASGYDHSRARDAAESARGGRDASGGTWAGRSESRRGPGTTATGDGGTDTDAWQARHTASNTYSPSGRDPTTATAYTPQSGGGVVPTLVKVGPWLGFHFAFLVSAIVTVWLFMTLAPSVTTLIASVLLLGLTLLASTLHIVSRIYS